MTTVISDDIPPAAREAFEADYFGALPTNVAARERCGNGYKYSAVQTAWMTWLHAWRAALAAPINQDAPAPTTWPKLEREAALHEDGTARFAPGVSAQLLVEAAYRNAERTKERQQMTREQRQEEESKRRALWDMVHGAPAPAPAAVAGPNLTRLLQDARHRIANLSRASVPFDDPLDGPVLKALDAALAAAPTTQAVPVAQGDALDEIRRAIRDYYFALDSRRHGGGAAGEALSAIEGALGMHWQQGVESAARAAKEGGA